MLETNINKESLNNIQYANIWDRYWAYFVDAAILLIITTVIQFLAGHNVYQQLKNIESFADFNKLQQGPWVLINYLIVFIYFVFFNANYQGATPGKKLLGIKIVKEDQTPLTYTSAIARQFGFLVSSFTFGIGFLIAFFDKRKQALHDKIAGTIVIKTHHQARLLIAIIITIIYFLAMIVNFALGFYKGLTLVNDNPQVKESNFYHQIQNSLEEYKNNMNPEAKTHYQRSQELFGQMKEAASENNVASVTQLNDENIQELKKALDFDPSNAMLWNELGNAYTWISTTGTLADGLKAYQKAETLDPDNIVFINAVGDMMINMDLNEQAVLQFKKTFRLTNESGYANLSIAKAYLNLNIQDQAKKHLDEAISIFSANNNDGRYDEEILEAQKLKAQIE